MRPVNLIPPEERRGSSTPNRTGSAVYFVVGGLALILVGVCAVVFLGNQVAEKEAEAAQLEAQATETEARAQSLASYVTFQQMRDARVATIDELAKSRFDWERVIRELSIVIPRNVWLSNVTGTVAPNVQIDDGAALSLRSTVPGPALELVGCARSQPDIARLIAAMQDIDGVTRVTAANGIKSSTPAEDGGAVDDTTVNVDGTCPRSAPSFELVAAFDAVVVPASAAVPSVPETTTTETDSTQVTTEDDVASTTEQTSEQQNVSEADAKVKKATDLVPGEGG